MGKARCSSAVCAGKTGVQASNTSRLASKPGSGRYFGQWDTGGLSSLLVSVVFILSFLVYGATIEGRTVLRFKSDWSVLTVAPFSATGQVARSNSSGNADNGRFCPRGRLTELPKHSISFTIFIAISFSFQFGSAQISAMGSSERTPFFRDDLEYHFLFFSSTKVNTDLYPYPYWPFAEYSEPESQHAIAASSANPAAFCRERPRSPTRGFPGTASGF